AELLGYANTYKEVFPHTRAQLLALSEKLKALPMEDQSSPQGLDLKNQLSQYINQIDGLKDHYNVHLDKLESLGFDLSFFGL
ncbi:MAG: hypothetical protein OES84_01245, partial [Kiritimatiellaceae bacterium]|nr:hypothetical protein [Kiritimatiellaceae bacterium]